MSRLRVNVNCGKSVSIRLSVSAWKINNSVTMLLWIKVLTVASCVLLCHALPTSILRDTKAAAAEEGGGKTGAFTIEISYKDAQWRRKIWFICLWKFLPSSLYNITSSNRCVLPFRHDTERRERANIWRTLCVKWWWVWRIGWARTSCVIFAIPLTRRGGGTGGEYSNRIKLVFCATEGMYNQPAAEEKPTMRIDGPSRTILEETRREVPPATLLSGVASPSDVKSAPKKRGNWNFSLFTDKMIFDSGLKINKIQLNFVLSLNSR